jgi:threonine/homoserine/homoserine lactone efflux protein
MSVEFLVTALIIIATPGTGALFTLASALSQGARAGLLAALAGTIGILPHMAAAITGLAALLHTSAVAFDILKYAGVAYLLYMAWGTWREGGSFRLDTATAPRGVGRTILSGLLMNLLNPKLSIFFVAFLPLFVPTDAADPVPRMLELSAVFMALTFVVFAAYALFAAGFRHHVLARPRLLGWLRRGFAAGFVLLGLRLAVTQR